MAALVRLYRETDEAKARITGLEAQGTGLVLRLETLEERAGVAAAIGAQLRTSSPAAPGEPASPPPQAATKDITTGSILNVAKPVAVASVAPPAAVPPTSIGPPHRPGFGVELTTAETLDGLRLSWSLLSDRHRGLLAPLQTRYRQSQPGSTAVR